MKNLKEYCRPATAEEAVALKAELGRRAVYLAGGSDLLVHRPTWAERAIDIRHADLGYAGKDGDWYVIGGAALLRDAEREMADAAGGMLRQALRETAPWLIRNAATVAGNIANASPAADSVPALLVLDAELRLMGEGAGEERLESVFAAPHVTTLGDRLIREIRIPGDAAQRRGGFIKLARSKSDIALVNVAVAFLPDGGRLRDVRIALGAVAPVPMRAHAAEAALEGNEPTPPVLREVERLVRDEIAPISDWRASAEYRLRMSGVLVRRAILAAMSADGKGMTE